MELIELTEESLITTNGGNTASIVTVPPTIGTVRLSFKNRLHLRHKQYYCRQCI